MTYETILRTVQVGLNASGGGVRFDIDMDQYDISQHKAEIIAALKANMPNEDAQAIYDTYCKYYAVIPSGGSPLDVYAEGPVVFLYVVDTNSANNWRFRKDGTSGEFMARKTDADLQPDEFAKNFGKTFEILRDADGVIMYGVYDNCTDFDQPGTTPHCIFSFDIFMKILQGNKVTNITIDPGVGNGDGKDRRP
ncbi:hypothetical protein [Kordiimonas sp. SCSIO 12610]|uniref:hypothetical protein n=1 Tax=Kordiimonas sp. SCSIO 12610 TaxID=2829597 RepID=UPI002108E451|nr:hypothetical protein [Kordiimonas sp. SCSIO 12610]UTW56335.1 hypothetical protein KFF44_05375 [Kordiimonas sp. SCSIO 12610]